MVSSVLGERDENSDFNSCNSFSLEIEKRDFEFCKRVCVFVLSVVVRFDRRFLVSIFLFENI